MSSDDKKAALASFQLVDINLDGTICLEELKHILMKRNVLAEDDCPRLVQQFNCIA